MSFELWFPRNMSVSSKVCVLKKICHLQMSLFVFFLQGKIVHQSLNIMNSFSQKVKIQQIRSIVAFCPTYPSEPGPFFHSCCHLPWWSLWKLQMSNAACPQRGAPEGLALLCCSALRAACFGGYSAWAGPADGSPAQVADGQWPWRLSDAELLGSGSAALHPRSGSGVLSTLFCSDDCLASPSQRTFPTSFSSSVSIGPSSQPHRRVGISALHGLCFF